MGVPVMRLCTICVRAGSKGVANKNLRPLAGKPLVLHSIDQARLSGLFDAIAVSSDSGEILELCGRRGVDHLVVRPPDLASDTAAKLPAIRHCVLQAEQAASRTFEVIVDLDATAPLRAPSDIVGAIKLLESTGASNVITGTPARRSPYFNLVERDDAGIVRLSKQPTEAVARRQDVPPAFDMNASIYVWRRDVLIGGGGLFGDDTRLFEMPPERSIDIDSELDWALVEWLMRRSGSSQPAIDL